MVECRTAGCVGIDEVVVGHLLALVLDSPCYARLAGPREVDGGPLMRVLAVAQHRSALPRCPHPCREALTRRVGRDDRTKPRGNGDVIGGGVREGLGREAGSLLEAESPAAYRIENCAVMPRRGDDGNVRVVLRRGSHHGRATDVDLLDAFVDIGAGRHRLIEGVEVDDDELERRDAQLCEFALVLGFAQIGEEPAMDVGMQGLHPALKALGESRHIVHSGHRAACPGDYLGRRPCRHDLDSGGNQPPCELLKARLVVHRYECPADRATGIRISAHDDAPISWVNVWTSRSRSTALIRSWRLSSVSSGRTSIARWAMIGPVSTPSSTTCTVQPVTFTP